MGRPAPSRRRDSRTPVARIDERVVPVDTRRSWLAEHVCIRTRSLLLTLAVAVPSMTLARRSRTGRRRVTHSRTQFARNGESTPLPTQSPSESAAWAGRWSCRSRWARIRSATSAGSRESSFVMEDHADDASAGESSPGDVKAPAGGLQSLQQSGSGPTWHTPSSAAALPARGGGVLPLLAAISLQDHV